MIAVSLYGLILLLVKLSWTVAFLAPEWGHGGGGGCCWSVAHGLKKIRKDDLHMGATVSYV